MALTRDFKTTIMGRVQTDPAFALALFSEAVNALLSGDLDTGKAVLRDYIKATIGFSALADQTGTSAKSLMRMFGPKGNPATSNLVAVLASLQRANGVHLTVQPSKAI